MAKGKKPGEIDPKGPAAGSPQHVAAIASISGETDEFGRPTREEPPEKTVGYNAADEKQIEAARKEAGQHRRQDRDFWRIAMSTADRRGSFYRLLERCHIYGSPADLGAHDMRTGAGRASDPHRTYFNLGEENVGKQMMLAAMDASTDLYLTMLKEQKEARDAKERKDDA